MAKTVKPSKPDKATRLAQARVVKLFSEAKYTEAEALVRGQLLRQPRDLQAVHMMGSSLFGLDRNAAPLLWRLLAAVLQSLGRLEDAV